MSVPIAVAFQRNKGIPYIVTRECKKIPLSQLKEGEDYVYVGRRLTMGGWNLKGKYIC